MGYLQDEVAGLIAGLDAVPEPTPPPMPPLVEPHLCLMVGGEDLTNIADVDSLKRSLLGRGEATCEFDVPLVDENEVPSNALVRDAEVRVLVDGVTRWLGKLAGVTMPQPGAPVMTVSGAGAWDQLHQNEVYCKGFVDTTYPDQERTPATGVQGTDTIFSCDYDGQVLVVLPKGTAAKTNQGYVSYYWVLNGYGGPIRRVVFTLTTGGSSKVAYFISCVSYPFTGGPVIYEELITSGLTSNSGPTTIDHTLANTTRMKVFMVSAYAVSDIAATNAQDEFVQITDRAIYVDRTTAPRVDEIAADIWTDVTGDSDVETEAIGSALTQAMYEPGMASDFIQEALARAQVPPLCGVVHGRFKCIGRPGAPPDLSRLWIVSDELVDGLQWDVKPDLSESYDYVCVSYLSSNDVVLPTGTPQRRFYPSSPTSNTARVKDVSTGTQLTTDEVDLIGAQAYAFYHEPPKGQSVVPYACLNGYGQRVSVEHMECWDWVFNSGKAKTEEAGPFLIDEVSIDGGIATLTIGASDGYSFEAPYRRDSRSSYLGAHQQRTRYRQWSKAKKRPSGKGWHRAGKRWWRYRYKMVDVESRYA